MSTQKLLITSSLIERLATQELISTLNRQPSVALLGSRQVGKSTLAHEIAGSIESIYLDLESSSAKILLDDARNFFLSNLDRLIILDEVHRVPEIFSEIRGVIDHARLTGQRTGLFLFLGSASIDLLRQGRESLAGRLGYVELDPINVLEANQSEIDIPTLWFRGGYPQSLLTKSDTNSFRWRSEFIRSYMERDLRIFSERIQYHLMEQLFTMVAYAQGWVLNYESFAKSLSVTGPVVRRYIELLERLLLVRILRPFRANVPKQYVKSPKIYIRDSGLLHALVLFDTSIKLYGNPIVGFSWEGFVIENLLSVAPFGTRAYFYRTAKGAEIDLVLLLPGGDEIWAIEIKRRLTSKVRRGFFSAREDIAATRSILVHEGTENITMANEVEAIGILALCAQLRSMNLERRISSRDQRRSITSS